MSHSTQTILSREETCESSIDLLYIQALHLTSFTSYIIKTRNSKTSQVSMTNRFDTNTIRSLLGRTIFRTFRISQVVIILHFLNIRKHRWFSLQHESIINEQIPYYLFTITYKCFIFRSL